MGGPPWENARSARAARSGRGVQSARRLFADRRIASRGVSAAVLYAVMTPAGEERATPPDGACWSGGCDPAAADSPLDARGWRDLACGGRLPLACLVGTPPPPPRGASGA